MLEIEIMDMEDIGNHEVEDCGNEQLQQREGWMEVKK